jgi:acyl-CoA synthetase (AMP-forming)/AMP-acid ligase II/acyl carrier protein/lauroyl/myristoyl acyltransferase
VTSDLWSVLSAVAARSGENDAILAPGRHPLTFAGLVDRIAATKQALNRLGIGRGDRVAIVLPPGPEMAVAVVSAIACAVAAPLNPSYTRDEFREYLARIRPKALLVQAGAVTAAREVATELGLGTVELAADTSAPAGAFTLIGNSSAPCADPGWNIGDDTGIILLTSGTTSGPKLVPLKPRHLVAYAIGINVVYGLRETDRSLLAMPLFHASGLKSSFLVPLINGAAVVCLTELDASSFFRHMEVFRPTWITGGYALLKAILDGVDAHRDVVERSQVRFIRSGTGRLDAAVKLGLERAFNAPVIEQYSSSETGAMTCTPMRPEQGKAGTVGRAVFNEVAIMGSGGVLLPAGDEGEIVVRGPSVFDGYLDDPEANQAAFVDGWYRTGDLGRLDAEGFLTITGRAKEIINRGGEKISPREIETVMAEHPAIRDVKAFGIPHPSLGEEIVAAVVLRRGASASEADLKVFAGRWLADFKVPRRIFFLDAFPLGASRKLDVRTLVRQCEEILKAERTRTGPAEHGPLSGTEAVVRDLWREVLDDDGVGIDDDFFLRGGDSLKAVELLVALERSFGIALPVDAMYDEAASIAKMAAGIDRLRGEPSRQGNGAWTKGPRADAHASVRPVFSLGDLATSLTLLGLAPMAWLLPCRAWPVVCGALARAHVAVRRLHVPGLEEALRRLDVRLMPQELQRRFLAAVYEDVVMTLREHLPIAWRPAIRLRGVEHLNAARAAGRGAVLWSCPSALGGLISKKALRAAGVDLVNLRSAIHPYSGTAFGASVLNPIRTRIEDRYLTRTVTLQDAGGLDALQELRECVAANGVVSIAANGSEGRPFELPFLGGTLKLSLGAPTIAALHGAPLLPMFTVGDDAGGFDVIVGPPIQAGSREYASATASARELARGYAKVLETHLRCYPADWRGWFMRNTWAGERSPGTQDSARE